MLANISSRKLSEWQAYARLEPFGEERADLRMGILGSSLMNCWRGKGDPTAKPVDLMPDFLKDPDAPPERQTTEDMIRVAKMITAMMGGTIEDGNNESDRHPVRGAGG